MAEERTATDVPSQIGRYRVLGVAGRWASGWLLHGHDNAYDRNVLLKTLYPPEASQTEALGRFANEARITACLNHRSIISIFEFDGGNHLPFMALEALGGESLAESLHGGKTAIPTRAPCSLTLEWH